MDRGNPTDKSNPRDTLVETSDHGTLARTSDRETSVDDPRDTWIEPPTEPTKVSALAHEQASAAGIDAKLARLRSVVRAMGSVLVCYSGGIDSAFLLAIAHEELGKRAVGMTAVSPSLAPFEKEAAISVAKQIGARHELVESHEIEDPNYAKNESDRCFHCKSELYRISEQKRLEWQLGVSVNGTNLDDLGDYRPGLEAAKESGVRSPLVECGFNKEDVRTAALAIGLGIWDKPAAACLSSRIPYGTSVTRERLAQIGGFEAELHRLGLKQVRVRWHALSPADEKKSNQNAAHQNGTPDAIARIEVARDELTKAFDLRDAIVEQGKRYGFNYVTLDLQGYRMGSHNEVLIGRALRILG